SPELAKLAHPGDTVFVYAYAVNGPRMPLAVQRFRVSQLPITVRLYDSMAMAPDLRLSDFDKVTVEARISQSGTAQTTAGDLIGRSGPLTTARGEVSLTIGDPVR